MPGQRASHAPDGAPKRRSGRSSKSAAQTTSEVPNPEGEPRPVSPAEQPAVSDSVAEPPAPASSGAAEERSIPATDVMSPETAGGDSDVPETVSGAASLAAASSDPEPDLGVDASKPFVADPFSEEAPGESALPADAPAGAEPSGPGASDPAMSGSEPAQSTAGTREAPELRVGSEGAPDGAAAEGRDAGGGPTAAGEKRWFGKGYWKQLKAQRKAEAAGRVERPAGGAAPPPGGGARPYRVERAERGSRQPFAAGEPPPPTVVIPDPARYADAAALAGLADEVGSGGGEPVRLADVYARTVDGLAEYARTLGLQPQRPYMRRQLLADILRVAAEQRRPIVDEGIFETAPSGHGFVVHSSQNYRIEPFTVYVPASVAARAGLRRGHQVVLRVQAPQGDETVPVALVVDSVMGMPPEEAAKLTPFEDLVPYYPLRRIHLEVPGLETKDISMRAVDIITPIGFGQRGLIVAPPRTGKTILLQNIANSIAHNFPEAMLIVLLVDERPEEVTDFRRHVKGEVVSSTFDESAENHAHLAEVVIEKARRLVECGRHVVILLDSITRLARAYNVLASNSGKIMSGGIEATALQKPKRFFGSARNIEGGGSLTILGTALVDTNSRMDEVIFEEFKGTGNMELHLDRSLVEKRIFPALNMEKSGTRKEELIYHPEELVRIHALRRAMQGVPTADAMEMLLTRLRKTRSNAEFLMSINR